MAAAYPGGSSGVVTREYLLEASTTGGWCWEGVAEEEGTEGLELETDLPLPPVAGKGTADPKKVSRMAGSLVMNKTPSR
jgi:hypothetical protein